ncbi:MAG: hypothetical protein ABSA07_08700 [Acidimicrobiales bacterium]
MKNRGVFTLLLAIVVVAAGALLINRYAFADKPQSRTTGSTSLAQAYRACVDDGATLQTAIVAFRAENPGVSPTKSALLGSARGGPYLRTWAHQSPSYSYSLANGFLYLHSGTGAFLVVRPSFRIPYTGPKSCLDIGL